MKRQLIIISALLTALVLAACGQSSPSTTQPGTSSTSGVGTSSTSGAVTGGTTTSSTSGAVTGGTTTSSTSGAVTGGTTTSGTSGAVTGGTTTSGTAGAITSGTAGPATGGTTTSGSPVAGTSGTTTSGSPVAGTSGTAGPATSGTATTETGTVAYVVANDDRFTTLSSALDAAGLTTTLEQSGPYTVFAPTNEAFAALPADTLNSLLANPTQLSDVLRYHVSQGEVDAQNLGDMSSLPMLSGQSVQISRSGNEILLNNNTRLELTDIQTTNGVIYVIDSVLIPPGA